MKKLQRQSHLHEGVSLLLLQALNLYISNLGGKAKVKQKLT